MSCYTHNRKTPYRAEVVLTEKKRMIEAEVASSTKNELDLQLNKLVNMIREQYEFKSPLVNIEIYHNEELIKVINSSYQEYVA